MFLVLNIALENTNILSFSKMLNEASLKCRLLRKKIDPLDYESIRRIVDTIIVDGKEEMWVVVKATSESINEKSMKQYTLFDHFVSSSFVYKRPKMKDIKTSWHLIII